jgi:hypothetical protein
VRSLTGPTSATIAEAFWLAIGAAFDTGTAAMRLMILAVLAISVGACAGSPEPPDRIVYLAIGASDAAGVGAEPLTRGYVFRIPTSSTSASMRCSWLRWRYPAPGPKS